MKTEQQIVNFLKNKIKSYPSTALILGSGWNKIIDKARIEYEFDFDTVFGVRAGVSGHLGKIIIGSLDNKRALFMAGRFHTYEGYSSFEVTLPIRVFAKLGINNLVLTAACGGLNEKYKVGDLVILNDILTVFLQSPLSSGQFQDLSNPFDKDLQKIALSVCQKEKINYQQGVYAYFKGPHYESFSDKKAIRMLGADVVGMSICPEVIMANYLGLKVLGLSCVTNLAFVKHSHKEVVSAAEKVSGKMVKLLVGVI